MKCHAKLMCNVSLQFFVLTTDLDYKQNSQPFTRGPLPRHLTNHAESLWQHAKQLIWTETRKCYGECLYPFNSLAAGLRYIRTSILA